MAQIPEATGLMVGVRRVFDSLQVEVSLAPGTAD